MSLKDFEIILRAPEPSDVQLLYNWENDPEIWKVSNTLTPFSRFVLEKYIESAHLDIYEVKQLRLMIDVVIKLEENSITIGTVDLFDFDPYHNRAGVGILIGDTTNRRQGFADAALKIFIDYCFKTLCLHQLYCNIGAENTASLALFKKHGFTVSGTKKEWIRTPKCYTDEILLQLINPDEELTG